MGLFAPVNCDICGSKIEGKKYRMRDGAMCRSCRYEIGEPDYREYTVEGLRAYKGKQDTDNEKMESEQIARKELYELFNKTRTLPCDIYVDDRNQLWYWKGSTTGEPPEWYPPIKKFTDIQNVWCEVNQGGILQTSGTGYGANIKGSGSIGATLSGQSTSGRLKDQSSGYVRYNYIEADGSIAEDSIRCNPAAVYEVAESLKGLMAIAKGETPGQPPAAAPSAADELRKFKALLDDGIITQEEFEAKKQKLLDA